MEYEPSPSIPLRSAARDNRRYSAAPESSTKASTRRPLSRSQGPAPASTEVISSLISSLSAISAPAENLYDNLMPNGTATKSAPATLSRNFLSHNVRNDIIPENPQPETVMNPDEAAIPPIVRTSKPPSGYSPLTAPKKNRLQPPLVFSASSIHDTERSRSSIGSISVEPRKMPSYTSLQTVSTLNSKGNKSVKMKESREMMRELDKERKRGLNKVNTTENDGTRSNHSRRSSRNSMGSTHSKGTAVTTGGPEIPTRTASWHVKPPKNFAEPVPPMPGSPDSPSKRAVPDRNSSLRHSLGSTAKRKGKKSSKKTKLAESHRASDADESADSDATPPIGKGKEKAVAADEDSVARRIQELKRQKELRRISQQTIAEQERSEEAARKEKSLKVPDHALENVGVARSVSAAAAPGKENVRPSGEFVANKSQRDPLMRSATEPIPLDHTKTFDRIAPGRVSTSTNRPLPSLADSIDEAIEDYLANPVLSQKVRDPRTGRVIAFSEVGDPTGSVVFCCVGMGTTRYLTAFYDELATTLKLRLITPDRPGIGESEPHEDGADTPLGWPDDIRTICSSLGITRFSILAHSAGAVYALATALRMPEHIRGRIHLMAPWIPPSQMVAVGIQKDHVPNTSLPYGQRLLRSIPTPFLKVANSGFFAMTSNSLASAIPKNSPKRKKRRSLNDLDANANSNSNSTSTPSSKPPKDRRTPSKRNSLPTTSSLSSPPRSPTSPLQASPPDPARQSELDTRLTHAIWTAATTNANPAVDLLVCLERRSDIGFRYADVSREVVIHHGSKDSRVPVENVTWLAGRMRRCEMRVLEGEGHGLMASASVVAGVLEEMGREWESWLAITKSGGKGREKGVNGMGMGMGMGRERKGTGGEVENWPLRS